MLNKKNHVMWTVASLVAVVAFVAGLFVAQHVHLKKTKDMSQFNGTLLDTPRPVNAFALMGVDKKPFNNASLRGQWTLVFFGFTHCGSMCPTTMAELGKMYRLLEEKHVQPLPRVLMITLDPARDSLDRLDHYVHAFNPHFYGARGNNASVSAMTHEMGIAYVKLARNNADGLQNYDIEHTGTVMLFNPQGELLAFFTTPHQAELLARDYELLIS